MRPSLFATAVVGLLLLVVPLRGDPPHRHHHHHHRPSTTQQILGFAARALPNVLGANYRQYSRYAYPSYGYQSYSYTYYPYATYYQPRSNYVEYYLPPVYYPAELAYGPQAMKSFMGLDRNFALRPVDLPLDDRKPAAKVETRPSESSPAALARARKFVGFGDHLFKEGKYHEALQQYKSANKAALDFGEAYFRQGFALAATSRFELAADAFKRGVRLDSDYVGFDFRLDSIYGGAHLAKATHLEALASTALSRHDDPELLFVLGVILHYAESPARAQKFFKRAAELAKPDNSHIRVFVDDDRPADGGVKMPDVDA